MLQLNHWANAGHHCNVNPPNELPCKLVTFISMLTSDFDYAFKPYKPAGWPSYSYSSGILQSANSLQSAPNSV